MADLVAIGYDDETTAAAAAEEVARLSEDLIIQPDAVAVIVRDADGRYHVTTNHHPVGAGATWGMFWGLLFGILFFVPVFGMAVGAGLGALMGHVEKTGTVLKSSLSKDTEQELQAALHGEPAAG